MWWRFLLPALAMTAALIGAVRRSDGRPEVIA